MKKVAILKVLLASFIAMGFLSFSVKGVLYSFWLVTTEGGTTDPAPAHYSIILHGTNFTVTAIPDTCHMLDHWEFKGVNMGAINPITVVIDEDCTLLAVFKPKPTCIGGVSVTIVRDKSGLLNPYLCLTSTILVAAMLTSAYFKRVSRKTEKT